MTPPEGEKEAFLPGGYVEARSISRACVVFSLSLIVWILPVGGMGIVGHEGFFCFSEIPWSFSPSVESLLMAMSHVFPL